MFPTYICKPFISKIIMNIPTVESLRDEIINNKKLYDILETREKRRLSWSNERKEEYLNNLGCVSHSK